MEFLGLVDSGGRVVICVLLGGISARSAYLAICMHHNSCQAYGLSVWILTVGAFIFMVSLVSPFGKYCQHANMPAPFLFLNWID